MLLACRSVLSQPLLRDHCLAASDFAANIILQFPRSDKELMSLIHSSLINGNKHVRVKVHIDQDWRLGSQRRLSQYIGQPCDIAYLFGELFSSRN